MGSGVGIVARGFTERHDTNLGESVMFHIVFEAEVVMFPVTPVYIDVDFAIRADTIFVVQVIVLEHLCYFQFNFYWVLHCLTP